MVVNLEGVGKTVGIIVVVLCIIVPCIYCLIISIAMYCGEICQRRRERQELRDDFLEDHIWADNGEHDLLGPDVMDRDDIIGVYGTDDAV